jgi:hypothetical protein
MLLVSAYRSAPAIHGSPHATFHDWNDWCPHHKRYIETTLLFRSTDGGKSWTPPRLLNVAGKEPYISVTKEGTLFITAHLIDRNIMNQSGYCYGLVHRSPDGGKSWFTTRAQPRIAIPTRYGYHDVTTRNVLQLNDGSLFFIASGLGRDANTVWRSSDGGETWDLQYESIVEGQPDGYMFSTFGESVLWQAKSGKLFAILRVDNRGWPGIEDHDMTVSDEEMQKKGNHDNHDRLILFHSTDEGRSWKKTRDFGDYGQMYPAITRLKDGRLLLTFTQRAIQRPLGLRAVIGAEHDDGLDFDLSRDVFVIEEHTPDHLVSGGGFGRTIQLDDGTLVSSYSYRSNPNEWSGPNLGLHSEIARWRLPE